MPGEQIKSFLFKKIIMEYLPTIGLEVHVELKTKTKMFCGSPNNPDEERPNVNICPVCLGHPGTLPVANKEAVLCVLRVGKALGSDLQKESRFDRKSYFYPDLPKGYQISQYQYPLVKGGELAGIKITRVHLEEDTGKLIHDTKIGISLVDYNRAGVPLMELVTEPVIHSGAEAKKFAEELQTILRYLNVSDADMEKGHMRLEANISVKKMDANERENISQSFAFVSQVSRLGVKVEVKNLNSFRSVKSAVDYEIQRQIKILENGEVLSQETRGWDEIKNETFSQREKEDAHDYRYLPDPDLSLLTLEDFEKEIGELPELPEEKRKRYFNQFGLKAEITEAIIKEKNNAVYFEQIAEKLSTYPKDFISLAGNYFTSNLFGLMKGGSKAISNISITPIDFTALIILLGEGKIYSHLAKDILTEMFKSGKNLEEIAKEKNITQVNNEALVLSIVEQVIEENKNAMSEFISGNNPILEFLVGQAMKIAKGKVDPLNFKKAFKNKISRE